MLQSWHAALVFEPLSGFFLPAAQLLHLSGLVKPVANEYRPCGHPMQRLLETAPSSVEYNPAGQSVECWNGKNMERKWRRKKDMNKQISVNSAPNQFQVNS
jgi:hypothetical protein